ncbi:MAG TPA: DUF502 domain-containing protein [Rhabdochlamydiaceae bacterium]|nr:DUF502 domain-containing protein [Rhabdochlamydiaceae bacterium]
MKKYLFTGLLTFLPLALTIVIVVYLFDLLTTPFVGLINDLIVNYEKSHNIHVEHYPKLILFISRVIVLILLFFIIFLLGFFGRKFFFKTLLKLTNKLLSRIPIVKSIYRISVDVTKAFFSPGEKTFKKTVLIPFPNENTHALGFITSEVPPEMKKAMSELDISIFVPTSPHPMSGFMLMSPRKYALDLDISIQDSFKFLVSCGVIHPGQFEKKEGPQNGQ